MELEEATSSDDTDGSDFNELEILVEVGILWIPAVIAKDAALPIITASTDVSSRTLKLACVFMISFFGMQETDVLVFNKATQRQRGGQRFLG